MPPLTTKQARFAKNIAAGMKGSDAARGAGYADKSNHGLAVTAARLIRHPDVQRAAFEHREARLAGPLAKKAMATLERILDDETAPAAARVQACRFILESAGHGVVNRQLAARHPDSDDKPLSQRTTAELEELLTRQQAIVEGLRLVNSPVIDVEEAA